MSLEGVSREAIEKIIEDEKPQKSKKRKTVTAADHLEEIAAKRPHKDPFDDLADQMKRAQQEELKSAVKTYKREATDIKKMKLVDEIKEIREKHKDFKKLTSRPEPRVSMSMQMLSHELETAKQMVKGRFGILIGRHALTQAAFFTESAVIPALNERMGREMDATGFGLTVSKNIDVFDEGLEAFISKYDFVFNMNPAWMIPMTFIGILGETIKRNEIRRQTPSPPSHNSNPADVQ